MVGAIGETLTEQRVGEVFTEDSMKAGMLCHDDISLACGWCTTVHLLGLPHPGAFSTVNEVGVFSAALTLFNRVEPSPLPAEWWLSTCDVLDVTSVRLVQVWFAFANVKRVPSATQCTWWSELLDLAIRLAKLNASAGLSGRDTMSHFPVAFALSNIEVAAQDESQHEMLLGSGVLDALEYGTLLPARLHLHWPLSGRICVWCCCGTGWSQRRWQGAAPRGCACRAEVGTHLFPSLTRGRAMCLQRLWWGTSSVSQS